MAFTSTQLLSISKILGITPTLLDAHITSLGSTLTTVKETAVIAEIARWDAGAGVDFTRIYPKERNFGAEVNPDDLRFDIKRNIALILEYYMPERTSVGTLQIG